jgi:hypothetical protein
MVSCMRNFNGMRRESLSNALRCQPFRGISLCLGRARSLRRMWIVCRSVREDAC